MSEFQKYEYRCENLKFPFEPSKDLNAIAAEGWRYVGMVANQACFERPLL